MTDAEKRDVVRDDLRRSMPFTVTRSTDDADGDGLTFEGYAAVWDAPTRIDSWEGTFDESIARGAFRKSIREKTPRLQFDHGYHPLIGSIPIGRITELGEDDRGLAVTARLTDNWLVEPVRDAIRDGGVDGMSFRFSVVREEWRDAAGKLVKDEELGELLWRPGERGPLQRTLKEVKVPELGPVVWPAYDQTSAAVRSSHRVTIDLARLDEPDQRRELARAVLMADAAERGGTAPDTSGTETVDAPPANGGHPSEEPAPVTGTPPATDTESAGEHESAPPNTDARALLREQIQRARARMSQEGAS